MIGTVLIGLFLLALVAGMPLATGLGVASIAVLAMAGFDQLAVPTNIYAGIAKYPLLAIPMFILAGMIFERSGVAIRLVRFVTAMVGEWTGSLAVVAVLVSMLLGGISGSGPADAAAERRFAPHQCRLTIKAAQQQQQRAQCNARKQRREVQSPEEHKPADAQRHQQHTAPHAVQQLRQQVALESRFHRFSAFTIPEISGIIGMYTCTSRRIAITWQKNALVF